MDSMNIKIILGIEVYIKLQEFKLQTIEEC